MGRKRDRRWIWLPKGVYANRGWLVLRTNLGGGKWAPEKRICSIELAEESKYEFFKLYEQLTDEGINTLRWLIDRYLASAQFAALSPRSQDDYPKYRDAIVNRRLAGGATFGDQPLEKITKRTIRRYLDTYPGKVAANRHIQFLKSVYSWGEQRYESVTRNPCLGVTLNKEISRDRYIEDWEYAVAHLCAASMRIPIFAPAMELSYLQRARRGEVFSLRTFHVREDGLFLERGKGSKNEITAWTRRLQAVREACKAIYPDAPTPIGGGYLLHNKYGRPYSKNALDSAWQRVMEKACNVGAELPDQLHAEAARAGAKIVDGRVCVGERFTFHDIKAKGVTDHENKESGHRSVKMRAVYDRKPSVIMATR